MTCQRCQGFLHYTPYTSGPSDTHDTDGYYRCLNCGNCEDALILHHRVHGATILVKERKQGQGPRFQRKRQMGMEL